MTIFSRCEYDEALPCTFQTAKMIAKHSRNKILLLLGITESFVIDDLTELFKNEYIESITILFALTASQNYRKMFKAAVKELKKTSSKKFLV